ncbi:MAG: type II toxin-antitoxin system VapC family toxin [Rubellimicrobium sp.]|nr:type II toxin-antitoxin system VapC family toxin [Rubellimicrobium sp.]
MTQALLLDTCAVIWAAAGGHARLRQVLVAANEGGAEVWISPITAWEIGNLARLGRIGIASPPLRWYHQVVARSGLCQADLGADELVAATELPGDLHRDPADRIIIATARLRGLAVVTRDRKILDYSSKGHVLAVAC